MPKITRWQSLARWSQYLYFLRFSILLLIFAPAIAGLNETGARTLTSGIVTPEVWAQYLCVAFFVVTAGFVSLIMARVVLINGKERFDADPPETLVNLLANPKSKGELLAVLIFQIPTVLVVGYMLWNGYREQVGDEGVLGGSVLGILLAAGLWWVVNAGFYIAYEMPAHGPEETVVLGCNAARTILFPRFLFGLVLPGHPVREDTLECVIVTPLHHWRQRRSVQREKRRKADEEAGVTAPLRSAIPGYGYADGHLYEAHAFSAAAVGAFTLLYFALWPMTAPIRLEVVSYIFFAVLMVLPAAGALFMLWHSTLDAARKRLLALQVAFTGVILVFLLAVALLYHAYDASRFPIFGLLLILITIVIWGLGGIGFFFDRFRVPVLTVVLVAMILFRALPSWLVNEEHYLSTAPSIVSDPNAVLTPAEIVRRKSASGGNAPFIIVTATGGGLHASAWTATVMSMLEEKFREDQSGPPTSFHSNILLASTVSGGSVGLMSYLNEIQSGVSEQEFNSEKDYDTDRVVNAAQCSSLEAIGWGMVYYDLPTAAMPIRLPHFLHFFTAPSNGLSDLDDEHTPLGKDRTWALRRGFVRNLRDKSCKTVALPNDGRPDNKPLTLEGLLADGTEKRPAFTMNSTTVEGGQRFLVANYTVPRVPLGFNESCAAESFLGIYGPSDPGKPLTPLECGVPPATQPADLPLATAAQMSATFPYVSSAARIPVEVDEKGLHFIDGGNYDNDGTSSAIEFIRSALQDGQGVSAPLKIIIVEIRNSPDANDDRPLPCSTRWNVFNQAVAPLEGFYAAGHESVTERNRVALDLLEQSFPGKLEVHRIVYADSYAVKTIGVDPLNWSLTPAQREEVAESGNPARQKDPERRKAMEAAYNETLDWFRHFDQRWTPNPEPPPIPPQGSCPGETD